MKGVVAGKNRVSATCQSTTKVSSRDKRQTEEGKGEKKRSPVSATVRCTRALVPRQRSMQRTSAAPPNALHLSKRFSLAACVQSGDRRRCVS